MVSNLGWVGEYHLNNHLIEKKLLVDNGHRNIELDWIGFAKTLHESVLWIILDKGVIWWNSTWVCAVHDP